MITTLSDPGIQETALYQRYLAEFADLPGWFWPDSIAIWDSLLRFQSAAGIEGHMLEIGVWQGKSAALAALHSRPNEICLLVDLHIQNEARTAIGRIKSNQVVYVEKDSAALSRHPELSRDAGTFRWIHIDGNHCGMAIINDMNVAHLLLSDQGVLTLDDFFNPQYPQITAAAFEWLNRNPLQMRIFLIGANKAYLCRPYAMRSYLTYVKDSLFKDMVARGRGDVTIWKSTAPSDMNTFGVSPRYLEHDYLGPDWDRQNIEI
jgi:hypothetical protein